MARTAQKRNDELTLAILYLLVRKSGTAGARRDRYPVETVDAERHRRAVLELHLQVRTHAFSSRFAIWKPTLMVQPALEMDRLGTTLGRIGLYVYIYILQAQQQEAGTIFV